MKFKALALASMVALITTISNVSADYGTAHIMIGKNGNGPSFQYWLDSSISSYGYNDAISISRTNWSQPSCSNANLWEISDASKAQIKYYVVDGKYGPGEYGYADYYKRNTNGSLSIVTVASVRSGTNFDVARIELENKNINPLGYAQKVKTTGHETGHALSLDHFNNSPAHSGDHWMKAGAINLTAPTSTDTDHLCQKW
ncbi:hypothetical protein [Paenibacillus sp. y28]|uniref:hypothetical protein n=1 Tax=Paenibacillus sp. y28 TaxID=3129110 RepID=UPI00301A037A